MRSRRMQRLRGVQRLRSRRLQVLRSLRGLHRVQLRLLHLVGRLPVHLLGANSSTIGGRAWWQRDVCRGAEDADRCQCAGLRTVAATQ